MAVEMKRRMNSTERKKVESSEHGDRLGLDIKEDEPPKHQK